MSLHHNAVLLFLKFTFTLCVLCEYSFYIALFWSTGRWTCFGEHAVFVVMLKTISSTATSHCNHIRMQAIKKTATMREKFLHITHTNHLNQTTITSLNTEENEYVTKSNHAFHILHCSVSSSVTKHPQVSRSVTDTISPYNSYSCLPSCFWTRKWSSSPE